MTEEDYIQKGFNHGYQLQKHRPELAKTIQDGFADKQAPYAQGFSAGRQEYSNEKSKEKEAYRPRLLKKSTSKSKSKDRGKGLDL